MSKRRAAGSGALLKWRKAGQVVGWVAVIDRGVVDGKRRQMKHYTKTQAEAQAWLTQQLAKKDAGTLPKPGRLTVADWLTSWLAGLDVRPRTREHYEGNVRLHLIPGLGSKPLGKLTAADVERFLTERKAAGLAPRTRHHLRAVLRNALKKAVRDRLIPFNVAAEAAAPKVPRDEMQTFDYAQVERLLESVRDSPLEGLFVLQVGLGIRGGELLGLTWKDVDFDRGVLHINRSLQWVRVADGGTRRRDVDLGEPKSKMSRRALPLSTPALEALRAHRKRQLQRQKDIVDEKSVWLNDRHLVFVGDHGEPLHQKAVWREWRRILAAADLPTIRPHDLRHTAGTLMRDQDVDIKVIQETLGHSSVSTTLDTYGHVTPGMRKRGLAAQTVILGGV
jgi:integrase